MTLAAELDDLCQDGKDRVCSEIERFQCFPADRRGQSLKRYWNARSTKTGLQGSEPLVCLTELIKVEMRRRSDLGYASTVSEYLQLFPELRDVAARVVSLVYEEFCILEERGETQDVEAFCNRYPDWKESLITQLGYHRVLTAMGSDVEPSPYPEAGEKFEEFQLLQVIGHGAYSRVFIAEDISLGHKRVVLKISMDRGREAEAQGALDHPHIVPVNSVVYDDDDLRGLSMPFRPGASLECVIQKLQSWTPRPQNAQTIWTALVESLNPNLLAVDPSLRVLSGPSGDGWRDFPVDGTFEQGVAWIGMVLARTLHFAHERETYHRDVKPGNVLLTLQQGPQLLDFNLAEAPHTPKQAQFAIQGGTAPYMAPEQLAAFLDSNRWSDVGAQADVYSLGLILWELLTAAPLDLPDLTAPTSRALRDLLKRRSQLSGDVRSHNPRVPYALEAIVRKCLQYHPCDRYASAQQVAEDLERFLKRLPPAYNVNPSRRERAQDWTFRNRKAIGLHVAYLTVLAVVAPFAYEQARVWMAPDAKDRPEFLAAVQAMDRGNHAEAIPILMSLLEEQPSAGLPNMFLGLAMSGVNEIAQDPSHVHYTAALARPKTESELREWTGSDPVRLAEHFEQFGLRTLDRAAERVGAVDPRNGESPSSDLQDEFELAAHALNHALTLRPDSEKSLHGLATIAEFQNHYEAARETLSRLIALPGSEMILSRRLQRSRVSAKLAAQLAAPETPEFHPRAIVLVESATEELARLRGSVPDYLQALYHSIRTEVLLTRAEIHSRSGPTTQTIRDAREAKIAFDLWLRHAQSLGKEVPEKVAELYRTRLKGVSKPTNVSRDGVGAEQDDA